MISDYISSNLIIIDETNDSIIYIINVDDIITNKNSQNCIKIYNAPTISLINKEIITNDNKNYKEIIDLVKTINNLKTTIINDDHFISSKFYVLTSDTTQELINNQNLSNLIHNNPLNLEIYRKENYNLNIETDTIVDYLKNDSFKPITNIDLNVSALINNGVIETDDLKSQIKSLIIKRTQRENTIKQDMLEYINNTKEVIDLNFDDLYNKSRIYINKDYGLNLLNISLIEQENIRKNNLNNIKKILDEVNLLINIDNTKLNNLINKYNFDKTSINIKLDEITKQLDDLKKLFIFLFNIIKYTLNK
jgi:hypothetical protein